MISKFTSVTNLINEQTAEKATTKNVRELVSYVPGNLTKLFVHAQRNRG